MEVRDFDYNVQHSEFTGAVTAYHPGRTPAEAASPIKRVYQLKEIQVIGIYEEIG